MVKRYGHVPPVWANEAKLGQVFLNLLINAAQAIPEGDPASHRSPLTTSSEDDRVVVEVTDTGMGMTPDVLSRAFEPFFTTKPEGEGTGLGLSICLGIIMLRGELKVASKPGKGKHVPRGAADQHGARRRCVAPVPAAERRRRKRVLVIDDEPGIGPVMRRIIGRGTRWSWWTAAAKRSRCWRTDDGFDRIFCDLMMTDLTGMDVHAAAASAPRVPAAARLHDGRRLHRPRARAFLQRNRSRASTSPSSRSSSAGSWRSRPAHREQ